MKFQMVRLDNIIVSATKCKYTSVIHFTAVAL